MDILDRAMERYCYPTNHRPPNHQLPWRNSQWVNSFSHRFHDEDNSIRNSIVLSDVSPGYAIRRILSLYDNMQYREAGHFIKKIKNVTLKQILMELPIDALVETIPQTLPILEALYTKLFLSDTNVSMKYLLPETVVMRLVRFFSQLQEEEEFPTTKCYDLESMLQSTKKLLRVIICSDPKIRKILNQRQKALDRAIEGMGQHGLLGNADDVLMHLHDSIKIEFEKVVSRYKTALQKLDDLSLLPKQSVTRSVSHGPAPTNASHQRMLTLRQVEIQERLIKNKTFLNVLEPTRYNPALTTLYHILEQRIDFDKDVLLQFTQLRKEMNLPPTAIVAPVLMRFAHGYQIVLKLISEVMGMDDDSDLSNGYHSDTDSAINMSGSSAYYHSRRELRNSGSGEGSSSNSDTIIKGPELQELKFSSKNTNLIGLPINSDPPPNSRHYNNGLTSREHREELEKILLQKEVDRLKLELSKAKELILSQQDKEKKLRDRLAEQAQKNLDRGGEFENLALGEQRPTQLIRRYGNLYAQSRVDALDVLDCLAEMQDCDDLKSKLLFSVVVLAFRSVQRGSSEIKKQMGSILQMPPANIQDPVAREIDASISLYLRRTADKFDLRKNIEEVSSQIWATLYDYPCLKSCSGLLQYIDDCIRLAWALTNQVPPFVIEYEHREFRKNMHVRFHMSNKDSDQIKTYLWPALLEGDNGPCVHKGVVIT